jgi:hypothetical protein
MYKAFFTGMETTAPIFAMGLFISMFVLMLLRTWGYKKKSDFDPVAALPLADEHVSTHKDNEVQP